MRAIASRVPRTVVRRRSRATALSAAPRLRASSLALIFGAVVAAALAGCKTLPPAPPETAPWEVRKAALQARDKFDLKGRIGVAVGQQGFKRRAALAAAGQAIPARARWAARRRRRRITSDGASLKVAQRSRRATRQRSGEAGDRVEARLRAADREPALLVCSACPTLPRPQTSSSTTRSASRRSNRTAGRSTTPRTPMCAPGTAFEGHADA